MKRTSKNNLRTPITNGFAFLTANPFKVSYSAVPLYSHFEQVDPVLLALDWGLPPLGLVSHGADGAHEGLDAAQQQQSRHQLQVLNTLPARRTDRGHSAACLPG